MNNYILYFLIYILIINIFALLMMRYDKNQAIKKNYRVSEKTLFLISFLLGAIGIYTGMYIFRHKTKHMKFTVGIPIIIIINVISIYCIISHVLIKI